MDLPCEVSGRELLEFRFKGPLFPVEILASDFVWVSGNDAGLTFKELQNGPAEPYALMPGTQKS